MGIYSKLNQLLSEGKTLALITPLNSKDANGKLWNDKIIVTKKQANYCGQLEDDLSDQLKNIALTQIDAGRSTIADIPVAESGTGQFFIHVIRPSPRLVIMGGGHVGAALCQMAAQLDYEIVLIDDRPSYANKNSHPLADQLICDRFDLALDQIKPSHSDFYVIVTRGHRHDRLCLEKVLKRESAYVGMIGSRRRVKKQLNEMTISGFEEAALARVHTPIGLPIGAVTEGEIAVSILAEITKVRRSGSSDEALQNEVLRELCRLEQEDQKAVLATIIRSQGSTPRKAGSQMIIFPDGSTRGTVGGGCSESEVQREALLCLDRGQPALIRLNLTADAAAEEGMVCGGVMEIYLELFPDISR